MNSTWAISMRMNMEEEMPKRSSWEVVSPNSLDRLCSSGSTLAPFSRPIPLSRKMSSSMVTSRLVMRSVWSSFHSLATKRVRQHDTLPFVSPSFFSSSSSLGSVQSSTKMSTDVCFHTIHRTAYTRPMTVHMTETRKRYQTSPSSGGSMVNTVAWSLKKHTQYTQMPTSTKNVAMLPTSAPTAMPSRKTMKPPALASLLERPSFCA
mmetsp:Transcript_23603/g.65471  ORF Transcript_23603/g.65471 Transcript_23603/m.65471 type:complete len:206 (+) Transcript_23603:848-1465(+)